MAIFDAYAVAILTTHKMYLINALKKWVMVRERPLALPFFQLFMQHVGVVNEGMLPQTRTRPSEAYDNTNNLSVDCLIIKENPPQE